jgi:5-methylcytosine-specific restriction enzyme subunit McrC
MVQCIQVYEQERLQIGQRGFSALHWSYLASYLEREANSKYFSLQANGVKFKNYVGVIQIEDLVIEILPKVDRDSEHADCQKVLLEMLRICKLLPMEAVGFAHLRTYSNHILELYIELFLGELEKLYQRGFLKKYRRVQEFQDKINGRLLLNKQLHQIRKDRFYLDKQVFDYDHIVHGNLLACLLLLNQLPLSVSNHTKIQRFIYHFRELGVTPVWKVESLVLSAKMHHYQAVSDIAHLLLRNKRPDIRFGQERMIALLFDMNILFEEYVYQQLLLHASQEIKVRRQLSKSFWQRHSIRPDILVEMEGQKIILDTKWRMLKRAQPSADDLKQLFVYMNYFDAQMAYLLFPKVGQLEDKLPIPYAPNEHLPQLWCGLSFCNIVQNGQLNTQLGKELLENLRMHQNQLPT